MSDEEETEELQPIIVKKIKKGGGHHGGAWKVAYADFVTAMMAFFLLLWLLNVTTDEQRNAIADYFDPTHPKVSQSQSGAGGILGGLSMTPQGSMASSSQNINRPKPSGSKSGSAQPRNEDGGENNPEKNMDQKEKVVVKRVESKKEQKKKELRAKESEEFKKAEEAIKQAIQENPELSQLSQHLIIDMTPEGLRIQIVDQEGQPMFPSGSARMYDKTRELLTKIADVIKPMPNDISVRGHTDSTPYGPGAEYTNWELSTDRANASRRVMLQAGLPLDRLNNVMGKADTEHLLPDDPTNARNRRISIILLHEDITKPELLGDDEEEEFGEETDASSDAFEEYEAPEVQVPIGTCRRTPGVVQFA